MLELTQWCVERHVALVRGAIGRVGCLGRVFTEGISLQALFIGQRQPVSAVSLQDFGSQDVHLRRITPW